MDDNENGNVEKEQNELGKSGGAFFGRTAFPEYGPYSWTEEHLRLVGDISGKRYWISGAGHDYLKPGGYLSSKIEYLHPHWYSPQKAQLVPVTFIIKASQPCKIKAYGLPPIGNR
ncbi:MAG: hypothetical protein M0Z65_06905 [Firmicutes bacterium]|uniref:copper resistance protein NlpE n=1 Tax=Melghirimyces thermohalophilus TaxID=1236220 RepID=UPI00115FCE87|nr:copper resistance protein NlpE [Melghirimyces thermohalophilus]MDA8352910.1 hypothetical protein [Bacillota bacterium]